MKGTAVHLLDDTLVITPKDLTRCDYGFLRRIGELRGELPDSSVEEFQGARTRRLTRDLQAWVAGDYRRRYSSTFTQLDLPRSSNMKELRQAHKQTVGEVRSLRVVAGGCLTLELAPNLVLASSPAVMLLDSLVDVVLERFARSSDLVRLAGHALTLEAATGREVAHGVIYFNNRRKHQHPGPTLVPIARNRAEHLATLMGTFVDADALWGQPGIYACGFCSQCKMGAKEHDDVGGVWGVRVASRETLHSAGISTLTQLAHSTNAPPDLDRFTWSRLQQRARLQHACGTDGQPRYDVHNPAALAALPQPDDGDIFFDFEGDPLWVENNRFEWGLEFLFGYIEADSGQYTALWATNQAEEKKIFTRFLDYLVARRKKHPGMHVYHFAFYEPATMRKLARRHRYGQKQLNTLLDEGVFVDLYETVKHGVHTSGDSYGLKALESLYASDDLRGQDVGDGGDAVDMFTSAIRTKNKTDDTSWEEAKAQLEDYNRADCRSTAQLRDWLLSLAPQADSGLDAARELLGAQGLTSELMLTPFEEESEDLSHLDLQAPGFDEVGVFYISSADSTDGKGSDHKVHTLQGRWGSGTGFAHATQVLVVYADPTRGPTDATGMVARRAAITACTPTAQGQTLQLRETTPAHDPATQHLSPAYVQLTTPPVAARRLLNQAKCLSYALITGPARSGKSTRAAELSAKEADAVVIDDAHNLSLKEALGRVGEAERVIVAGDPALAEPINRRAFPVDEAHGPFLSWLLGDSGAEISQHDKLNHAYGFHPAQAEVLGKVVYPQTTFHPPHAPLLPPSQGGLTVHRVDHWARRGVSPEEATRVVQVVEQLVKTTALAPQDILVSAVDDAQTLLLTQYLRDWPEVQVLPLRHCASATAAAVVVSLGISTLADAPLGPARPPLAPHVLGQALSRGQEATHIVCSSGITTQPPPRTGWFGHAATFMSLLQSHDCAQGSH